MPTPDPPHEHPPSSILTDGGERDPSSNTAPDDADPDDESDHRDDDSEGNIDDADETKSLNIEIPSDSSDSGIRYAPACLPICQYEILDGIKEDYALTWRGLLMISRRDLDGGIPEGEDQYDAINSTRKFHGLTWRGMLIHAIRVLGEDDRLDLSGSDQCHSKSGSCSS